MERYINVIADLKHRGGWTKKDKLAKRHKLSVLWYRTQKGFTLIELLVVIAIIALLLSIVAPSLKRAREAGMRILCLSNMRGLAQADLLYASENDDHLSDGITDGPYGWVNHEGAVAEVYYNHANDPENVKLQEIAIRRGVLWPYTNTLDLYRCPNMRAGSARAFGKPASFAHSILYNHDVVAEAGASRSELIKRTTDTRSSGTRMLFIDEGWGTPHTWMIFYSEQRWWDPVPMRHAMGTNLVFLDGHAEYWKWTDQRTHQFAREADEMNTLEASLLRRLELGNDDISRLVRAVWGNVGWSGD